MVCKFPYVDGLSSYLTEDVLSAGLGNLELDTTISIKYINSSADDEYDPSLLSEQLKQYIESTNLSKTDTDFPLSEIVHKDMKRCGLTRHMASNIELWNYMAVNHFYEYVEWRWGKPAPKSHFTGPRIRSQAIMRLWFWAEMTYDYNHSDDPYHFTRNKCFTQDTFQYTLEVRLPQNNRTLLFMLEYIKNNALNTKDIQKLFKLARIANASRKFEYLKKEEIITQFDSLLLIG